MVELIGENENNTEAVYAADIDKVGHAAELDGGIGDSNRIGELGGAKETGELQG